MKQYFSYDDEEGMKFHDTEEDAEAAAENALSHYAFESEGDGWPEGVESVCWGEVKQWAAKTNVHAPDPEYGEDPEFEYMCNYELVGEKKGGEA